MAQCFKPKWEGMVEFKVHNMGIFKCCGIALADANEGLASRSPSVPATVNTPSEVISPHPALSNLHPNLLVI